MSIVTTNMSLTSWNSTSDYFNHTELANNWDLIDQHDHTSGNGVKIPAGGIDDNAITGATIADGAVTEDKIGDGEVTAIKLAASSVDSTQIGTLPGARVYRSTAQSINNTTSTALIFDTDRFNGPAGNELWDSGVNPERLVAPVSGVYVITGHVEWASDNTGIRTLSVRYNGTTNIASLSATAISGSAHRQSVSTVFFLTTSDYVTLVGYQSSGGALNANSSSSYSAEFSAQWICA